jgi:hypothetical protein
MSRHHDNGRCAKCGHLIADCKGEPVMATHWRVWIVCRACAEQQLSIGELVNTVDKPAAQLNA